jgi:hypothetical protein
MMLNAIAWLQAQPPSAPASNDAPRGPPPQVGAHTASENTDSGMLASWSEFRLTIVILVFALAALTILYLLVRKPPVNAFVLRIFVITILVFGSLLVVSTGYVTEQITPIIGFFGTIAGYLLGRGDRPNEPPPK